jgi:RNA polymerase sporulation-specific sigma factor
MDEIISLIKKAQAGDKKAYEIILEKNKGLIWNIVNKFNNRNADKDDLFQLGSIGLIKCIKNFDLTYDVKFSTYAVPMIYGEIRRFLRDDGIIKVSRTLKEISTKANRERENYIKNYNIEPDIKTLAKIVNVSVEELVSALDSSKIVESIDNEDNTENNFSIKDKLPSNINESELIINKIDLNTTMNKLSIEDRKVIQLRYFQDKTQTQVAKIMGISQVQVSRMEKKILLKMKKLLAG